MRTQARVAAVHLGPWLSLGLCLVDVVWLVAASPVGRHSQQAAASALSLLLGCAGCPRPWTPAPRSAAAPRPDSSHPAAYPTQSAWQHLLHVLGMDAACFAEEAHVREARACAIEAG